jgi:pyridoxine 4-dehydrogenase
VTSMPPDPGTWRLGSKDVQRVGFGTMRLTGRVPFGAGSASDYERAVQILRRAVELGVNHFDTAAFYRSSLHGANELIKSALWPYSPDLVIATKVRSTHGDGPSIADQINENRRLLGLESLDLVYLRVMGDSSLLRDFSELVSLQEAGVIRDLGLSGVDLQQLSDALTLAPVVAIQNRFGIGVQRDEEMFRSAATRGIAFVPYFSVAAEGKHDGAALTDHDDVRLVARRHGVSTAAVRIAWTLMLAPNVLAIPGTGSLQHLEENVAAGTLALSPDDVAMLGAVT